MDSDLRVGINARTLSVEEPGGAVQIGYHVIRELSSRPSIEIIIFGHSNLQSEFDPPVVSTGFPVNSQVYGFFWERMVLPLLASKWEIDVLYCPNTNAPLTGSRFDNVITYHDVNALDGYANPKYRVLRKLSVPPSLNVADKVITVSEFSKSRILEHHDIDPNDIKVIYNGIDSIYLDDSPGQYVDVPDDYILFTGSLNPRKNIQGVIDGFRQFNEENKSKYNLVFIGPGNKNIFGSVDIDENENIYHLGFLSKDELKSVYRNALVFLFPSFYEGFGLPPLEAMACGTPVIASNVTALPEVLGNSAELVTPHEPDEISASLTKIISNECYREMLIERGLQQANQYTWDRSVSEIVELLEDVGGK